MRSFLGPVKRAKVCHVSLEDSQVRKWVPDIAADNTIAPTVQPNFLAVEELEVGRRWRSNGYTTGEDYEQVAGGYHERGLAIGPAVEGSGH
jgi:hypothetical protein